MGSEFDSGTGFWISKSGRRNKFRFSEIAGGSRQIASAPHKDFQIEEAVPEHFKKRAESECEVSCSASEFDCAHGFIASVI